MASLRSVGTSFAIGLIALAWSQVAVAQPSGTVIAVVQSAQIDGQTGKKILQPEAPVFSGDHILTGAIGEAQVKFRDNTKLVVGPNSMMIIDAFVFNDDNTARKISINAVRGAFRFITGNSRKDAYTITTPTATIGVRGTEFDFNVESSGATHVAVFAGATKVCDRFRRNCVEQTAGCNITAVDPGQEPRRITDRADREREIKRNFRYVRSQVSLRSEFRVNVSACNIVKAELPTPGGEAITLAVTDVDDPPPPPPPPPPTGGNRSGLSDDTNPGQGALHSNSGNQGTDNPGGGGG